MRRMVSVILTVAFMLGAFAASAEGTGALDAFAALTGQQAPKRTLTEIPL